MKELEHVRIEKVVQLFRNMLDANHRLTKTENRYILKIVTRAWSRWKALPRGGGRLIELLRTNDLVLISRVEAILAQTGIEVFVADRHMSAIEGSLSFLPRRVLVASEAAPRARKILIDAGLAGELHDG